MRAMGFFVAVIGVFWSFAVSAGQTVPELTLPALDNAKLAAQASGKSGPFQFAQAVPLTEAQQKLVSLDNGSWRADKFGDETWQANFIAEDAVNVSALLEPFRLPHGAELWARSADGKVNWGPFTEADNTPEERFYLPIVTGQALRLELRLPASQKAFLRLGVKSIFQGYRGFGPFGSTGMAKAGGCNVDMVCPEGDPYRNEARAVVLLSINGTGGCTGTLVNNTRADRAPLILTARHCYSNLASLQSTVAYFNYQSSVCRPRTAGTITSPPVNDSMVSITNFSQVATSARSDFTLMRPGAAIPAAAKAYWMGWDRQDVVPTRVAVIHHPNVEEKRVTTSTQPVALNTRSFTSTSIDLLPGTGLNLKWSAGTTEPGSSGSALFRQDTKRIIGTLSGGDAKCSGAVDNGEEDTFGRLFTGWEGSGTAASRLKDHLDPLGTAPLFMDGLDSAPACSAPVVNLNASASPAIAGEDVTYTAQVSGGAGNYRFEWDLDGDGTNDRSGPNVNQLTTRYDRKLSRNLRLVVTDSANCQTTVSRAFDVVAPNFVFNNSLASEQLCGNNNTSFDPGERWRIRANVTNTGTQSRNAIAQFVTVPSISSPDEAGYRYGDSLNNAACTSNYIALTGAALPITAASSNSTVLPQDEGRTAALGLGADSFSFYDQSISTVAMSTNGYLMLNPSGAFSGNDFDARCNNSPTRDVGFRRIRPFHADLIVNGGMRAVTFPNCPRASAIGSATQKCLVFDWRGVDLLSPVGSVTPTGRNNFDMQAVVYPDTGQIVYQYRNTLNSLDVAEGVVGLMNTTSPAFNYQCRGTAALATNRAVCFFNRNNLPTAGASSFVTLTQPAIDMGNIGPNGQGIAAADISLSTKLACGQAAQVKIVGVADQKTITNLNQDLIIPIAQNCTVVTNCATPSPSGLRGGSFFNPYRSGNGLVSFLITRAPPQLPLFFGAWFTGEPNRAPIWYIVQGDIDGNHVNADILKVVRNINASTFSVTNAPVGKAQVSIRDPEHIVLTYQFDQDGGQGRNGGEQLQHLLLGAQSGTPTVTGHYYDPSESGWGQTYESFLNNNVAQEFVLSYLYDSLGQPRWTLALEPITQPNYPTSMYQVHCPTCAWLDIGPTQTSVGTMTRSFPTGFGPARVTTNLTFPAPYGGTWLRNNVQIFPLSQNPGN